MMRNTQGWIMLRPEGPDVSETIWDGLPRGKTMTWRQVEEHLMTRHSQTEFEARGLILDAILAGTCLDVV